MARSEARISVDIWDADSDFIRLSPGAQWLYFLLLTQPDLNHLGVLALRERRWARKASNTTVNDVRAYIGELGAERYVVVDEDTEELLIRSFIRRDKVYRQPNVLRAAADNLRLLTSAILRRALAVELRRIQAMEMPDGSVEIVAAMLAEVGDGPEPEDDTRSSMHRDDDTRPSMSHGGDDERPSMSPVREGPGNPSATSTPGTPGERGVLRPYVQGSPSPYPQIPDPLQTPPGSDPRAKNGDSRGTRLPADFEVTESMKEWARENAPLASRVDHEMFVDHWRAQSGQRAIKRDWEATWRNWMRRVEDNRGRRGGYQPTPGGGGGGVRRPSTGEQRIADVQAALDELNAADAGQGHVFPLQIEGRAS